MTIRRVLFFLLSAITLLAPIVAEAGCTEGHLCWRRRYSGGSRSYVRSSGSYGGYGGGYVTAGPRVVDPEVVVVRQPGFLNQVLDPPVGAINTAFGWLFGQTALISTRCADDDIGCHRSKGRAQGRFDGRSAVADQAEDTAYVGAYNQAISIQPAVEEVTDAPDVEAEPATTGGTLLEEEPGGEPEEED